MLWCAGRAPDVAQDAVAGNVASSGQGMKLIIIHAKDLTSAVMSWRALEGGGILRGLSALQLLPTAGRRAAGDGGRCLAWICAFSLHFLHAASFVFCRRLLRRLGAGVIVIAIIEAG